MNLPENRATAESFDRFPWHKPTVQRLVIAVDTRQGGTSVEDLDGLGFLVEDEVIFL